MMDLSLDDIIKTQKFKRGNKATRGRLPSGPNSNKRFVGSAKKISQGNGRVIKSPRKNIPQNNNRSKTRTSFPNQKSGVITDARLKIISKNRQHLKDAREKLSQAAKLTDARTKIKGRNQQVARYPDRRPRQRQEIRNTFKRNSPQPVVLQRSIQNNVFDFREPSSLIRCTINRPELQPYRQEVQPYRADVQPYQHEDDMEVDSPLPFRTRNDLSSIKIVAQNEYQPYKQDYNWPSTPEPIYVDHYKEPTFSRELQSARESIGRLGGRMSQEMRDRLDTPPKAQYRFNQGPISPPPSQGHRIVVSNLHPSVSHEDIKELFEDIGPLLTSHLVRPGTAEVIYKLQKDAKKAVEAYHNRQLDGQPMKCLLVNPRTSPGSSGVLRSNNMPAPQKFPVSSKSMVVPDLSAIHKALFTSK